MNPALQAALSEPDPRAAAALELGPRSDREIRHSLETQIEAERWTRLDRALVGDAAARGGVIDLRPEPGQQQEELRAIKIGRMRKLEALSLAYRRGPAQWSLAENAEEVLREARRTQ